MGAWKKKLNRILESPFTSNIVRGFFYCGKKFFFIFIMGSYLKMRGEMSMSKKRKVVLGLTILVGLFCMAIGITAAVKENEPQLLHAEVTDDVTAYYVKEKGEYYLYTVVEQEKTEEEIRNLPEDAESYSTCFVIKLEKDWINKEMLEEWEK